eukprot:GHVQ01028005.1.p1 GENE.GHVQ01028005.1~~GHVQ01028005.1.p1  ORF type:complete len:193 (+),score=21.33 GHVQ01028005.1:249-827(+)
MCVVSLLLSYFVFVYVCICVFAAVAGVLRSAALMTTRQGHGVTRDDAMRDVMVGRDISKAVALGRRSTKAVYAITTKKSGVATRNAVNGGLATRDAVIGVGTGWGMTNIEGFESTTGTSQLLLDPQEALNIDAPFHLIYILLMIAGTVFASLIIAFFAGFSNLTSRSSPKSTPSNRDIEQDDSENISLLSSV